jgi:hypothetical protein
MASGREHSTNAPLRCEYGIPGAAVTVEVDDPALSSWLDEFLLPGFDHAAPATTAATVVVCSDAAAPIATSAASTPLDVVPCFALDREIAGHPARKIGDSIVVTDERYGTEYRLEPGVVRVLRHDRSARSRAGVMRVVRELVTAQSLADGTRLQLHGAALAHGGRTIVLAGPKEAGKTTLTTRLAAVGGLPIVGNDRLLVMPSPDAAGSWTVRGIATVVSIRPGTRTQLPGRFDDLPDLPSPAHLTLTELDAVAAREPARAPAGRLKLSPAQLARAAGVSVGRGGDLHSVLLLAVDPALDGYALEPSAPDRARAELDAIRYGSRREGSPRTVFEEWLGVQRPAGADDILLEELASSVSVRHLRVGPRVLRDDALAAELLEAVVAGA